MENKVDYVTETQEALDMLNHKEPAVVIERPRVVAERQPNGEFVERTIPVYVKYSTAFKEELKNITGSELKVWTYIILSINESGEAFPGIRTIADAIDMSHQTVITAVEGLEKKNLLYVLRGEKRYNIYKPSDEYVGIFSKDPMSQKIRPVQKSEQMSQVNGPDESSPLDSNQTLTRQEQERLSLLKTLGLEWLIAAGQEVTQDMIDKAVREKNAKNEFEKTFGFGTLPWSSNSTWAKFEKFIVKIYSADPAIFTDYVAWRKDAGKYTAFSNKKIRENPAAFMDTGYPEFEASKMYSPSAPQINEAALEQTKELIEQKTSGTFVPRPANLPPPSLVKQKLQDAARQKGIRR
jgi:DNA-binding transcriptional regulator GbsR (MarR family)